MNEMPTYKEFTDSVKENYMEMLGGFNRKEVIDYFNSDESKEYIRIEYNRRKTEFTNGKITRRQFIEGGGSAVGYCLSLCFE